MQDEERYMTLNVQLKKRRPSQTSQLKFKVSQGVLLKCPKGTNSSITQHDDIGNLNMKSDTRGNISTKDADHCASSATDRGDTEGSLPDEAEKLQEADIVGEK
ncbi:Killer cell lectin-like receptor subfamily F member 1 [Myotis brandtii]|uniref:Killer cell lectin-like receptor subfamily F member 1 n=1 Tax=Myotis brandtii TaxID=109478 RepID=S7PJA1_MYOBR|nr:Killer cell lectin-like receptor subfamily F member 1 [Myotis brandtii]